MFEIFHGIEDEPNKIKVFSGEFICSSNLKRTPGLQSHLKNVSNEYNSKFPTYIGVPHDVWISFSSKSLEIGVLLILFVL